MRIISYEPAESEIQDQEAQSQEHFQIGYAPLIPAPMSGYLNEWLLNSQ